MKFHPLADILPAMMDAEYQNLKADIKKHGLHEPIWTLDDRVLDGRHRYRACKELGIDCPSNEFKGDDPIAFVVSANVHRRHLTPSQLSMIAARARECYDEQAKERQKRKPKSVVVTVTPQNDAGKSRDLAGAAVGVSGTLVDRATKVIKEAEPEVAKAVDEGRMSVTRAAALAEKPAAVQRATAEAADMAGGAYHNPNRVRPKVAAVPLPEPTERQKDIAYKAANDAINVLQKIGRENPLRAEAFKIVSKWMKHNA